MIIRSDAPWGVIWDIMLKWVKQKDWETLEQSLCGEVENEAKGLLKRVHWVLVALEQL
jgi:hypothetical protein